MPRIDLEAPENDHVEGKDGQNRLRKAEIA